MQDRIFDLINQSFPRGKSSPLDIISQFEGKYFDYNDKDALDITKTLGCLNRIYSSQSALYATRKFTIHGFKNVQSHIPYDKLKPLILELICNSLKANPIFPMNISIIFDKSQMKLLSKGERFEENINSLKNHIKCDYPTEKYGIGLFIIEKIINNSLKKQIEIYADEDEFGVTIPLLMSED